MFEDLLDLFKRQYYRVQKVRIDFTPTKEQWYSWNYWAQHTQKEFSFGRWMAEHNIEYEDVSGSKTHYPEADVEYNREAGWLYYNAWRGGQFAVDEAEKNFDNTFKKIWSIIIDFEPYFTNKILGEAIGMDAEALRKFAAKRSWYFPRKTKGNK